VPPSSSSSYYYWQMPDAAASASQEDKDEEAKEAVQAGKPSAQGVARWTGENLIHLTSWKRCSPHFPFP
jgi:hypothetical protein